jgi:hypothetical protein
VLCERKLFSIFYSSAKNFKFLYSIISVQKPGRKPGDLNLGLQIMRYGMGTGQVGILN